MQVHSENTMLAGVVGKIEATVDRRIDATNNGFVAVCCHPHPQHGGAMGNKVIYTASRTLASCGVTSVRFNFRGVGQSEGEYADGVGEKDDLAAVVEWCNQKYHQRKLILCGFSFGAYISALQAESLAADVLISIAPPIGRVEFTDFKQSNCPWLIIQGEEDELVDANKVKSWVEQFSRSPEFILMPQAAHFFHGKLPALRETIESFIEPLL